MAVLYRKYRPQTFAEVLNQKHIIRTLQNQVAGGQVAHAYLFTGSRGVGKTSVARILAKAVNCVGGSKQQTANSSQQSADSRQLGEACGVCENCRAVAVGNFLDLVEIDAASNTGVDNIRELIEHVKFSPSQGKYKVFIIDEVHMLSKGAFNALLKTLEEPPKHAIFILATTEINKVPATIISRTQRFDFKALPPADLFGYLEDIAQKENINFSKDILELVAQNAEGSARDALSLLDKLMTLGEASNLAEAQALLGITDIAVCENLLALIVAGAAADMPEFFEQLLEKGLDFRIFNRDFLEYLRKALVFKISSGAQNFNLAAEHVESLQTVTSKLTTQDLMFTIRLFLRSYKELDSSPKEDIPLLLSAIEAAMRKTPLAAESKALPEKLKEPVIETALESKTISQMETITIKAPIVESFAAPEVVSDPLISLTLLEVEEFWPNFIAKIKQVNGPLASVLRAGSLLRVDGGRIILGVKFLFDKKTLENTKNFSLLCQTLEQLTGKKIIISGQVIKPENVGEIVTTAEALSDALKVFGGELIE